MVLISKGIQKPDHLKLGQMAAILSKTTWNFGKNHLDLGILIPPFKDQVVEAWHKMPFESTPMTIYFFILKFLFSTQILLLCLNCPNFFNSNIGFDTHWKRDQESISKTALRFMPNYLCSTPNFRETFCGVNDRHRAWEIGVGQKSVHEIDPSLFGSQNVTCHFLFSGSRDGGPSEES